MEPKDAIEKIATASKQRFERFASGQREWTNNFWVDIESPGQHEIVKKGAKVKISGTVRKREKDGSMWPDAPICPKTKLYIVLQSQGADSSKALPVWGVWMLYREMVWIETDDNGKFSFEINTMRFPILHNISSGAASSDEFMATRDYQIGYSDNPGLENLHFTATNLLVVGPRALARIDAEMKKLLKPFAKIFGNRE